MGDYRNHAHINIVIVDSKSLDSSIVFSKYPKKYNCFLAEKNSDIIATTSKNHSSDMFSLTEKMQSVRFRKYLRSDEQPLFQGYFSLFSFMN